MKYDAIYFINKFDAIPDEKWTTGSYENEYGQRCAIGHCAPYYSLNYTEEVKGLMRLFYFDSAAEINDGYLEYVELGDTPKERIINALLLVNAGVEL
jgi:hypothetical protein